KLNVAQYLLLGKGEEQTGGRRKKALLADCTEALFGACYVHNGFPAAKAFVSRALGERITAVVEDDYHRDYKTALQEYMQKKWRIVPTYRLVSKTGPDHNFTFYVEVDVNGQVFGPAHGRSKKAAEQAVAKIAYQSLVNPQSS
ncbi:MAG TPA: putative dsRNA-binding protein, partial [Sphaerochaeta sp.]|nr:putative dsRNA-binding protein [Sphaerochaeta sp.]